MVATDKPNPFQVLELPIDATRREVASRGQELAEVVATEEERLLIRWAMEQLMGHPDTRLEYELFEMPGAHYRNESWAALARANRRNPFNQSALMKDTSLPGTGDFDLAALARLLVEELIAVPPLDLRAAAVQSPFRPDCGPPPLEVRDVLFW